MSELLPTPTAGDAKSSGNRENPDNAAHDGLSLTDAIRPDRWGHRPISVSSQASAGWISRWKRRGLPVSDRSSGMTTAPESSNDGGRLFPVGEMSRGSPLLPSPDAGAWNDGQTAESWTTRHERERAKGYNGNGGGTPIAALIPMLASTSSSAASPASQPLPPADGREPPTIVGSGRKSPVSLASYDPALSSWRTSQVSLLSTEDERFPRSSERWPTSGMTRRGRAFALPMSERATAVSGSSYLPTPVAADEHDNGGPHTETTAKGGTVGRAVKDLLHTPTTGDTVPNYDHRASPGYTRAIPVPNLAAQVDELLPTPSGMGGGQTSRGGDRIDEPLLGGVLRSLGEPTNPPSEDGSE